MKFVDVRDGQVYECGGRYELQHTFKFTKRAVQNYFNTI